MRILLALIPALAFVALPQRAAGFELPNGNVVWDVATADYDVRIEQTNGSELGSMTLTNRATGEIQHGDLSPAFIYDRDGSQDLLDEFYARGLFAGMLIVEVELYDEDGTAFDGATVKPGYPAALMIPSPPPLALFETARVTFSIDGKDETSTRIVALPEPGVAVLVLALLGCLALRRQRPHRLVYRGHDGRETRVVEGLGSRRRSAGCARATALLASRRPGSIRRQHTAVRARGRNEARRALVPVPRS